MTTLFSNSPIDKSFTINFFYKHSPLVKSALLACPFFTDPKPIEILKQSGCEKIRLLVRLCESTSPDALAAVHAIDGVDVRFFTDRSFHAKFYILGDNALVGSANMTSSGMQKNRELSVIVRLGDEEFDEIPTLFDELWNRAGVLTKDAYTKFATWYRRNTRAELPPIDGIGVFSPLTKNASTKESDQTRAYLENFRALYQERLLPAHRELEEIYSKHPGRHPAFNAYPHTYEIYQFLYWVRGRTTNEELLEHPLRSGDDRTNNIWKYVSEWFENENPPLFPESVKRIIRLKDLFADEGALIKVTLDDIADLIQGCAAFTARQRFARGGLDNLVKIFKNGNRIEKIHDSFHHLIFDDGDYVQRIYDCVFLSKFKLSGFGRNCMLELFGWVNTEGVPPLNGRAIEALRLLGFDVPFLDVPKLQKSQ